jgi:hypothetical protein
MWGFLRYVVGDDPAGNIACFQLWFCAMIGESLSCLLCGELMVRKFMMMVLIGAFGGPVFAAGSAPEFEALKACGADQVQDLTGQLVDGSRDRFGPDTRIIPPNSAITQDYRPDRLNVDLDEDGLITRIWCG